ncbi:MAG: YhcH/YjgK/YiaL family protein [Candidatus Gastranaerophilaceae bacterium]
MIKDSLKYSKNYYFLSDKIKLGLEYLEKTDLMHIENGRYEICGNEVFINIQDYNTKPLAEGKWEAHRKYIDIQYIIEGSENIGVGCIDEFLSSEKYDAEKDLEFLKTEKIQQFITVKENEFLILYPNDVHMPQISCDSTKYVKKAVLKIAI